jgi:alpha-beta hydrolase superfamily lysophospholipase
VIGSGEDGLMSIESDVDHARSWGWAGAAGAKSTAHQWDPPVPVAARGTVVVLPGRGEHAGVYVRLGTRLAVDGYRVLAADPLVGAGDPWSALVAAVAELAETHPGPLVLLGSDVGAALALRLASVPGSPVSGVVAAGLWDGGAGTADGDWDGELDARTACPTHRALLAADAVLVRGALSREPSLPDVPVDTSVPVLFVHGEQDAVTGPDTARALAAPLPRARVVVVRDGRHDVLNDLQHRTVAAEVVQFLERLRGGPDAAPILVREPVASAS